MFEATLKNRSSAHFAPVTITFPIPEDQYEQAILALEKSQIGDARVQDCLVENVSAPNCPALLRMTGTMANVDELDWLGKQLESFDRYELLQFNAAVERFGLSAADELIDLSFCAREVTVISDFSDLELVGKRHYGWLDAETEEIVYNTNGMPDITANEMYHAATVSGTIDTIPETPGLAVWHDGHIGVYIGNGEVVEAMGTRYGVVKTKLEGARWTHWLKIPYISYD